jgi:hypothetical protein
VTAETRALPALAQDLALLAAERVEDHPSPAPEAARLASRLRDHLEAHVLPRVRSLDAPLLILLVGPTGAGKSSLANALAGRRVSPAGVLRPTTRELVVLANPADHEALLADGAPLPALAAGRLRIVEDAGAPAGVAIVDAPDIDSVEHANRDLTARLAEAADLGVFVTTASRYADRAAWDVLLRARDRGLPLVVVVNRMPGDPAGRADVLDDLERLLAANGVEARGIGGSDPSARVPRLASGGAPEAKRPAPEAERPAAAERATGEPVSEDPASERAVAAGPVRILAIREGALDPAIDGLGATETAPLRDRIHALALDREARRSLAARALSGSLAGLAPLLEHIADDIDHEAIDAEALRRTAADAFAGELRTLREDLGRGTFLRTETLRQWQAFVGADEVTRLFARGIGRVRGTLSALVRGTPRAPVAEVREDAVADMVALSRRHAAQAARRVATAWADAPATRDALADNPALWGPTPDFEARLAERLEAWLEGIGEHVRRTGGSKRTLARGASIGVNAAGLGVMLATFAHTGGLTGAEVGVAAATGLLNQKLLEALFGEAATVEMVDEARRSLDLVLAAAFAAERGRFDSLVPPGERLRDLAARLRAGAHEVRALRPALPDGAQPQLQLRPEPVVGATVPRVAAGRAAAE